VVDVWVGEKPGQPNMLPRTQSFEVDVDEGDDYGGSDEVEELELKLEVLVLVDVLVLELLGPPTIR